QDYEPVEIIVVDDCSSDYSMEVLKKYESYSHVKIIDLKKNNGYANACNIGVDSSSGKYIMFAECDDYNEPDHISILVELFKKSDNIGVVYSKSHIVDSCGNIIGDDFQFRDKEFKAYCKHSALIPKEKMQLFLLNSCVIPNMSAALFKREYFENIAGISSKYKACADWDLWCRISE
ncbi:MAG: glycosyltransferase, partial [bacterium]|nr:glycosyltransferase [bacterium]